MLINCLTSTFFLKKLIMKEYLLISKIKIMKIFVLILILSFLQTNDIISQYILTQEHKETLGAAEIYHFNQCVSINHIYPVESEKYPLIKDYNCKVYMMSNWRTDKRGEKPLSDIDALDIVENALKTMRNRAMDLHLRTPELPHQTTGMKFYFTNMPLKGYWQPMNHPDRQICIRNHGVQSFTRHNEEFKFDPTFVIFPLPEGLSHSEIKYNGVQGIIHAMGHILHEISAGTDEYWHTHNRINNLRLNQFNRINPAIPVSVGTRSIKVNGEMEYFAKEFVAAYFEKYISMEPPNNQYNNRFPKGSWQSYDYLMGPLVKSLKEQQ